MTDKPDFKEAMKVCERWLKHINQQKENTITLQKAAALARKGDKVGAMRLKSQVYSQSRIFDGANFLDVMPQIQLALRLADRIQNGDVSKYIENLTFAERDYYQLAQGQSGLQMSEIRGFLQDLITISEMERGAKGGAG